MQLQWSTSVDCLANWLSTGRRRLLPDSHRAVLDASDSEVALVHATLLLSMTYKYGRDLFVQIVDRLKGLAGQMVYRFWPNQKCQHCKLLSLFLYLRFKNAVPVELRLVRLSELPSPAPWAEAAAALLSRMRPGRRAGCYKGVSVTRDLNDDYIRYVFEEASYAGINFSIFKRLVQRRLLLDGCNP